MTVIFKIREREIGIPRDILFRRSDTINALVEPSEEIEPIDIPDPEISQMDIVFGKKYLTEYDTLLNLIERKDKGEAIPISQILNQYHKFFLLETNSFIEWLRLTEKTPYQIKIIDILSNLNNPTVPNPILPQIDTITTYTEFDLSSLKCHMRHSAVGLEWDVELNYTTEKFYGLCKKNNYEMAKWAYEKYSRLEYQYRISKSNLMLSRHMNDYEFHLNFVDEVIQNTDNLENFEWFLEKSRKNHFDDDYSFMSCIKFGNEILLKYFLERSDLTYNMLHQALFSVARNKDYKLNGLEYLRSNGYFTEEIINEMNLRHDTGSLFGEDLLIASINIGNYDFMDWILNTNLCERQDYEGCLHHVMINNELFENINDVLEILYQKLVAKFPEDYIHTSISEDVGTLFNVVLENGEIPIMKLNNPEYQIYKVLRWASSKVSEEQFVEQMVEWLPQLIKEWENPFMPYFIKQIYNDFYHEQLDDLEILKIEDNKIYNIAMENEYYDILEWLNTRN